MANGFQQLGNGDHKVLVLHGWFGDHTTFDPMRAALSLDEFTYVLMDYRGVGKSKSLTGDYTNAEIATDALALMDRLGWERASLVGHSMGGKAIQKIAAIAPQRVDKLVGITPVPAAAVPFDDAGWALFEGAAGTPGNREAIIDFTTGNRNSKTWVQAMAAHSLETSTAEAFAAYLRAWAKEDFAADVQGMDKPMLVVVGEHDAAITAEAMQGTCLAWYPNARLELVPNAGHYPMYETPVQMATLMERFLRAA